MGKEPDAEDLTPAQIAQQAQQMAQSELVLDPYSLWGKMSAAEMVEHPDLVTLASVAKEALTSKGLNPNIITLKSFTYALLRCKFDQDGRWLSQHRSYVHAYGTTCSEKMIKNRARALEAKPEITTIIQNVRETVLTKVLNRITEESIGLKANRVMRQSQSWERLRRMRDELLPPEPNKDDFEDEEKYAKAIEEHKAVVYKAATVWTLELTRIEEAMGKLEDRVAEELGQRTKLDTSTRSMKAYEQFDPEKV